MSRESSTRVYHEPEILIDPFWVSEVELKRSIVENSEKPLECLSWDWVVRGTQGDETEDTLRLLVSISEYQPYLGKFCFEKI